MNKLRDQLNKEINSTKITEIKVRVFCKCCGKTIGKVFKNKECYIEIKCTSCKTLNKIVVKG